MNKKYFVLFICAIVFLTIISITIAIFSNTNEDKTNEKINQEIDYIETKFLGMLNSLNNISFSNNVLLEQNTVKTKNKENDQQSSESENKNDGNNQQNNSEFKQESSEQEEGQESSEYTKYNIENRNILIQQEDSIDWNYLKNCVEVVYSSWPAIMIDLHSINVKNADILNFSTTLDELVISIENEDKKAALKNLQTLYSLLPIYMEQFTTDINKINIMYTKSKIINAYVLLEDDNWDMMQEEIKTALDYFSIVINSVSDDINKTNISKTYISINEMNNVIKLKDKKLFYLKYINLMESIMHI